MMSYFNMRGVPVGGSRERRLRALAAQATQQRRDLVHEMPPAEAPKRGSEDGSSIRIEG